MTEAKLERCVKIANEIVNHYEHGTRNFVEGCVVGAAGTGLAAVVGAGVLTGGVAFVPSLIFPVVGAVGAAAGCYKLRKLDEPSLDRLLDSCEREHREELGNLPAPPTIAMPSDPAKVR